MGSRWGQGSPGKFCNSRGNLTQSLREQLKDNSIPLVPLTTITFQGDSPIGRGSRSEVFAAKMSPDRNSPPNREQQSVAAKSIDVAGRDRRTKKPVHELLYYLKIFQKLQHENVVRFIGVICGNANEFYELTELCDTDLEKFTASNISKCQNLFPDPIYCKIFTDTCKGMAYIHNQNVVHRDLKADNILLSRTNDGTFMAKIADFGLAKNVGCRKRVCRGPARLNPPEALECFCAFCQPDIQVSEDDLLVQLGSLSLTDNSSSNPQGPGNANMCLHVYPFYPKSDVYMFGAMLFCVSHKREFFGKMGTGKVTGLILRGERPNIDRRLVSQNFENVIQKCWHQQMDQRPSFQELVEMLQNQM